MKIGIIGAGKVGTSLGKYFVSHGLSLTGFFDSYEEAAEEAADFTGSRFYQDLQAIVEDSDTLFLTVPDGLIRSVWKTIKDMQLTGKNICHCSGALSAADAFPEAVDKGAYAYSTHPLFAVSDKFHSYQELEGAYFTIEGDNRRSDIIDLFSSLGNPVCQIRAEDKSRYHLAAAIVSNHMVALMEESIQLMQQCGFTEEGARAAFTPIVKGNISHLLETGTTASLTGPVERGDLSTIEKHLHCLNKEDQILYKLLSRKLLAIGKRKNPDRDYSALEAELQIGRPE